MVKNKIKGALTAVLTAFKADLAIDFEKTISHAKMLLDKGLDGVVFFGTTGEGNSINVDEKKQFVEKLIEAKFPLNKTMIGTGACSLMDAVNISKFCVESSEPLLTISILLFSFFNLSILSTNLSIRLYF